MKSLLKIYGRYIGSTWVIILLLVMVNLGAFAWIMFDRVVHYEPGFSKDFRDMAEAMVEKDGEDKLVLSSQGKEFMEERQYAFLMLLNDEGDVIFGWNLPEDFKEHYTIGEISGFTRWYLQGYPVKVWQTEEGLLVAGAKRGSIWKYSLEMPMEFMNHIGWYARIVLEVNLLIILCVVGFLGYRYYKSLCPLSAGIEALSQNRQIHLSERGPASQLAVRINRASDILGRQRQTIQRRDMARTEWIAGVSHDIRTPLSVIMGYADELMENEALGEAERERAAVIRNQSLKIRQLIEDLNLTSKLEYDMQPLRVKPFYPAVLLRTLAAEFINEGLGEQYEVSLEIQPELERIALEGDEELMKRAVRNLLGNSARHNPQGCRIWIEGRVGKGGIEKDETWKDKKGEDRCVIEISDDGCGIPEEVISCLLTEPEYEDRWNKKKPHIMGLRIVKQIVQAHKGDFQIVREGHCIRMSIPVIILLNDI